MSSLTIVESDFEASCDCEDFTWHRDMEQSEEEFKSRRGRSHELGTRDIKVVYGTVEVQTRTSDKQGARGHSVVLSRGDGVAWSCKHILKALTTQAIMPDFKYKAVCFSDEEVEDLESRHDVTLVATCNAVKVVGWGYDASL